MTDITPNPEQSSGGIPILSMKEVFEMEKKVRENKAAQLRGDPLPHLVTPEMLRDAIKSIRANKGTMNLEPPETRSKKGAGGGGAKSIIKIDLDDDELLS